METHRRRTVYKAISIVSLFFVWSLLLYYVSPSGIVDLVGEDHAYLVLFLAAFLGGSSILVPFPYYVLTLSFGAAGLHPLLLGLAAGAGTLLGDSITYYVASRSRTLVPSRWSLKIERLFAWAKHKHPALVPVLAFLYAALLPFPDDVLMIPAGLSRYPFFRLALGVFPGKVVYNIILALAGLYGWQLFF